LRRCCYKHFLVIDDVDFVCVVVKRKISRCRRIDIIHYWNVYTNSLKIQSHSHSINNTWRNVQQKSVQQNNVLHKETSNYNFKSTSSRRQHLVSHIYLFFIQKSHHFYSIFDICILSWSFSTGTSYHYALLYSNKIVLNFFSNFKDMIMGMTVHLML